ncbi:serine O-acetyltransferase [Anaerococcus tetradius]|uniref:serine O-acetyltransferase n=1 Tax=Anaerococcus tetradius TaxID=33036 RepID=UPI0023F43041|nr:DapH/DapD/GlmU-related protein [Anaerococcus tetradius]
MVIGDYVNIGNNCKLYHGVTLGQNRGKFPKLGNNIIIYSGAKVIGDVNIGDNSVIGANSVVTNDMPSDSIIVGSPAKVVGKRTNIDEFY